MPNYGPNPNEKWRYVGKGDGCLTFHHILEVKDDHVVTWSAGFRVGGGGDSWYGPMGEFLKVFRPV